MSSRPTRKKLAMPRKHILVSDIDGTLLRNGKTTQGLGLLKTIIEAHRQEVALVYATGRSFPSTWRLVSSGLLPTPDAVASFVGTEVWFPDWLRPDQFYQETIRHQWNRDTVLHLTRRLPGLTLQSSRFQTPFKVSFLFDQRAKLYDLTKLLDAEGLRTKAIYSCGKYLDIIPANAGKRAAVDYLRRVWSVSARHVLTCGDSGNDLDMLMDPLTNGVAVGNSESEVNRLLATGLFYKALQPFASGLIEGAAVLGFWPKSTTPPMSGRSSLSDHP